MQPLILTVLLWGSSLAWSSPLASLLEQYANTSPSIQADSARILAAQQQINISSAYPAPELGLEWGNKAAPPTASSETMYYGGFTVGQEIPFPGKRDAMQKTETARFHMAQADYQAAKRNGAFQVAQTYLEIYMLQQQQKIVDSNLALLSSLQESARRRMETGMQGMEDLFRLQAEEARLRNDSIVLNGEVQAKKEILYQGFAAQASLGIPDRIAFPDSAFLLPTQDSLLALVRQRPELIAMASAQQMAASETAVAKLRKMPDLMLQGRYMAMMGPNEWSLMVGIKVPVAPWSSIEYTSTEATAKAQEQEAQARNQAMQRMLEQEVRTAYVRYTTAQARQKQAQQAQLSAAENAFRSSLTTYGNNKSNLSMTLDALRMLLMAHQEIIMAKTSFLMALLDLENAAGQPPLTWLKESTDSYGEKQ